MYLSTQEQQEKWNANSMRFFLNLVYFLVKLCQNTLSDLGIRGGFTQFILQSRLFFCSYTIRYENKTNILVTGCANLIALYFYI